MKYYLMYDKNNKIVGYSNCVNISNEFECREVTESEYNAYLETLKQKQEIENELNNLYSWYDNYYLQHEQKYRRLHTLGRLTDEGANPYDELIKLYNEAEIKRARIQELERLLSDSSK